MSVRLGGVGGLSIVKPGGLAPRRMSEDLPCLRPMEDSDRHCRVPWLVTNRNL